MSYFLVAITLAAIGGIVGYVLGYEANIEDTHISESVLREAVQVIIREELLGDAWDGRKL